MNQLVGVSGTTPSSSIHPTPTPTATKEYDDEEEEVDDLAFEGVAANVKLLVNLVEDHKQYQYRTCNRDIHGTTHKLRVATMLAILDNVQTRNKGSISKDDNDGEKLETVRLKREVKNLKIMCTSLGKEKDMIAKELSKKVQQFTGMEELVNDLRLQNEALLAKLRMTSPPPPVVAIGGGQLQERNQMLSEQLLKSLEGYRRMKRNLRAVQEENVRLNEMWEKVAASVDRINKTTGDNKDLAALEGMVEWFRKKGNGANMKSQPQ